MSVALSSPPHGTKRFLEEDNSQTQLDDPRLPFSEYHNSQKRVRHVVSPSGRCGTVQLRQNPSYIVGASTFTAVRALFPTMTDKVIADTLAEFGDNVDAAIKHLNDLQLSTPGTSKQHALQEQQRLGILGNTSLPQTTATKNPHAASENGTATAPEPSTTNTATPAAAATRTADEWIEILVQEMSAAADVADAKQRASTVLRAFEQAVMQHTEQQTGELSRENALLKRAVGIQNSRLQELLGREAEAVALQATLEATNERVHALEVQNYSLQLHLRRATDAQQASFTPGRTNPDVY